MSRVILARFELAYLLPHIKPAVAIFGSSHGLIIPLTPHGHLTVWLKHRATPQKSARPNSTCFAMARKHPQPPLSWSQIVTP